MGARTSLAVFNKRVDSLLLGISDTVLPVMDRDIAIREAVQKYNRDMPRRSVVEFAGDAGAYYLLHGLTVNIAESNQDAGIDLRNSGTTTDEKLAIQFTLSRKMLIHAFAFYLQRTGEDVDGELVGSLYTDSSDLPVTKICEAERVDIDGDAGAPEGRYYKVEFTLTDALMLPAGTYHAAIEGSGYTYADGTTEVILGVQQSSTPTNTVSTHNGTSWAVYGTDSAGILEVTASTPGWRSQFGTPLKVEYPAADIGSDEAPNLLEDDQWEIYYTEEGVSLRFPGYRPSTTELVRITIMEPFVWTEAPTPEIDTPPQHFDAICYLAAHKCCLRLVSKFGQLRSSTLMADVADRSSQARTYKDLAKSYMNEYNAALGMGEESKTPPASAIVDLDLEPQYTDGSFLFHGKRKR